jgi:hypothetical protein
MARRRPRHVPGCLWQSSVRTKEGRQGWMPAPLGTANHLRSDAVQASLRADQTRLASGVFVCLASTRMSYSGFVTRVGGDLYLCGITP